MVVFSFGRYSPAGPEEAILSRDARGVSVFPAAILLVLLLLVVLARRVNTSSPRT